MLDWLQRGNQRFASGKPEPRDMLHDQRVTAAGQYPRAVLLSCIDSRAPAEFIFDVGLGDLFNARIAGNNALSPKRPQASTNQKRTPTSATTQA